MKSTVNRGDDTQEITYPCLMEHKEHGMIVFFHSEQCGIVLDNGKGLWGVGHYSERWKMKNFAPFSGSVTLEIEWDEMD